MKSKIFLCLLLIFAMFMFAACGGDDGKVSTGEDGRIDGSGVMNDNNANNANGGSGANGMNGARSNDSINNGGNTYNDAVNGADGMGNGVLGNSTGSSVIDQIL